MSQGIVDRDVGQLILRTTAEWPATGCQHQSRHLRGVARAQTLVNGSVLGVDRDQFGPRRLASFLHDGSRRDQRLLVRQRQPFASVQRGERDGQASESDNRVQYSIGGDGSLSQASSARDHARSSRDIRFDCSNRIRIADGHDGWLVLVHLREQEVDGTMRPERNDAELLRVLVDDIEGLGSDGTGGPKYGYVSHGLLVEDFEEVIRRREHEQEGVESIEHTAVAGQQIAHVLDTEVTLDE